MEKNNGSTARALPRGSGLAVRRKKATEKELLLSLGAEKLMAIVLEGLGRGELEMKELEKLAKEYAKEHRKAFENAGQLGQMQKYWQDENGVVCIAYTSGAWYHYKMNGSSLEWW